MWKQTGPSVRDSDRVIFSGSYMGIFESLM
jgi:hypothetical protein